MRALSLRWFLGLGLALAGGVAQAQQTYNPDGTPSMITPEGQFAEAPGAVQAAPGNVPGAPLPQAQENFGVDCDPDIQNCADPGDQAFDDGYDPNAYQQFEGALAPYGQWVQDPNYGQVWVPSQDVVGSDFEPYETGGQWVASNDYGFTWVSDFDWGWAPFHYGRWTCLDGYGWGWIPGTIWGPSWVNWRYGGGYVGWAPMGPRGVIVPPPRSLGVRSAWRFAVSTELFRRNPTLVPAAVASSVWARTSAVNNNRMIGFGAVNARINLGPPISTLSRDLGRPIPAMGLRNTAPSVLPRSTVVARPGVTMTQRPYMRTGAPTMVVTPRTYAVSPTRSSIAAPAPYRYGTTVPQPAAHMPSYPSNPAHYPASPNGGYRAATPPPYAHPVYQPAPTYQQPTYHSPTQTYQQPTYHSPAQTYSPPAYHSPAQTYSPPSYHYSSPAQTYSPPAYHSPSPAPVSRPSFSAPSIGGGGHRRH